MTAPQRMRAWGAGVSAGYVALGVVGAAVLHVPGAGLLFGLCAAVTLALALIAAPLLQPRRGDDDGGLGAPPPEDPPWWPDFERELRAYSERLTSIRERP
jgi:hypothetical protein